MISVLLVQPDGTDVRFSDTSAVAQLDRAPQDPPEREQTEVAGSSPAGGCVRLLVNALTMLEVERALILYYLDRCGGVQRRAAAAMGMPRATFNDHVRKMGLVAVAAEVKP